MALNPLVDTRDSRFVLFELFETEKLSEYELYADFDRATYESTLNLAEKIAVEQFYPANAESDKTGCQFDPATKAVTVPACIKPAIEAFNESGFLTLALGFDDGGSGMPHIIRTGCMEYFMAGCMSATLYPTLSLGAANLIRVFGTEEQKSTYLEKIHSGEWGGTMCLTEPEAGSDVGALKSKAVKQPDGTYRVTGQKIFISSGDNDLYANIIHPVLARVEGDPKGTKGISIFIVPKIHVNEDGSLGEPNDVVCAGIEHKMGIKGSATCTLSFGDNDNCVGYLLGQERAGMKIMFQMMNEARYDVALQGHAVSSAAYMHAVTYARNRIQSVDTTKGRDPAAKPVAIVRHPDVKRTLLWMKSRVEGTRMLMFYAALNADIAHAGQGDEAQEAQGLLDLLIPLCKAGCTDTGVLVASEAVQVYGGYGYISEYPVEQYMRDAKIATLYEGTNGIQSIDMTMRKILMNPNQFNYKVLRKRMDDTLGKAKGVVDDKYIDLVARGAKQADEVLMALGKELISGRIDRVLANATPLREALFLLTLAWLHLWSLTITAPQAKKLVGDATGDALQAKLVENQEAAYYQGKVLSSEYFLGTEFTSFFAKADYILSGDSAVTDATSEIFTGALEQ